MNDLQACTEEDKALSKFDRLIEEIEKSDVDQYIKDVLEIGAYRLFFNVWNNRN